MLPSLEHQISRELSKLEDIGRARLCPPFAGSDKVNSTLDGRPILSFCSNDYLGLSSHPSLAHAASAAIARSGLGAGASRLVSGDLPEHRQLEHSLARFLNTEATLLFPTGYQTNLGVVTALAGPGDLVLSDHANHASIIDACRLSGARPAFYRHLDLASAEKRLRTLGHQARRRLLVTESLFGMDGHIAPLQALADLAKRHDAALIVDEAHALGACGPFGRGLCFQHHVLPDVLIGTLGKAFGASGGFAAGTHLLRNYLLNHSRTFLFTTALPPPVAAAALAALHIIEAPEGQVLRDALAHRASQLADALPPGHRPAPGTPIFPIIFGADTTALQASSHLRAKGFFVQAIRPPTVPEGTARLRITLSAKHRESDIDALSAALAPIIPP